MKKQQSLHSHSRVRYLTLAVSLAVTLAFTGCASMTPKTPQEQVKDLALKRWEALIGGKWETAYAMLAPSYRAVTSFNSYRGKFGVGGWSNAEVHSVICETESACTARMVITLKIPSITHNDKGITAPVNEAWVEEDGKWWMLDK